METSQDRNNLKDYFKHECVFLFLSLFFPMTYVNLVMNMAQPFTLLFFNGGQP